MSKDVEKLTPPTSVGTVFLVVPTSTLHCCNHALPIHLIQLATYVREITGVDVRIVDLLMDVGFPLDSKGEAKLFVQLLEEINTFIDDRRGNTVVGFSLTSSSDLLASLPMMEKLKSEMGWFIICGGYAATLHSRTLARCEFIDHIVCGPGEEALSQLIKALQNGWQLPRMIDGRRMHNSIDLSSLTLDFSILRHPTSYRRVLLYTSFGCPFACRFCYERMMRPQFIHLNPEKVCRDIKKMRTQLSDDVEMLRIADPIWCYDSTRANPVLTAAREHGFKVSFETRVDVIPKKMWRCMDGIVDYIIFGFESASEPVLQNMGKCLDGRVYRESMKSAARQAWAAGIVPRINLIMNYPGASYQDHCFTVDYVAELRRLHDQLSSRMGFMMNISWYHAFGDDVSNAESEEEAQWADALPRNYHGFSFLRALARVCTASSRDMSYDRSLRLCKSLRDLSVFSATKANTLFRQHMLGPGTGLATQSKMKGEQEGLVNLRNSIVSGQSIHKHKKPLRSESMIRLGFPRWPGCNVAEAVHREDNKGRPGI